MMVSRNEIESLSLKSARGAGMSWGLAEEAAAAACWLAERGLPWAETLVGLLHQQSTTCQPCIDGDAIVPSRAGSRLCPVRTGALLSDLGSSTPALVVRDVLAPLWLAPFLARWTGSGDVVRLRWLAVSLSIERHGLSDLSSTPADAPAAPFASRVEIEFASRAAAAHPSSASHGSGYLVPDTAWHALQALEQRTYVPASAQSRLSGAGAGLLDND
jgi:hypothetical protein